MQGETQLDLLLKGMKPKLHAGKYVFATVATTEHIQRNDILGEFKEEEGTTVILAQQKADALQLSYEFVAAWITLTIHSSLEAHGLTAAFATTLAKNKISCNVIAGYYHDHLFVPYHEGEKAIKVLNGLAKGN